MLLPARNALATSQHGRWLDNGSQHSGHVKVTNEDHHDTSPPLRDLGGRPTPPGPHHADDIGRLPRPTSSTPTQGRIQTSIGSTLAPATTQNFAGIGQGFSGPAGTFSVNAAPPDTNGDVGPNHYVQVVNSDFAVWSKTGTVLYGPVALNTLWQGFGGSCETNNDGDPVVKYDRAADRWIISQFSVTGADGTTTPFLQCVAVSQTPDPTGAYYRYAFPYAGFND